MTRKNRYYTRSRIAERTFRQLVRYFSLDLSASDTARLTSINVRSVNTIDITWRQRLAEACEQHSPLDGQVEVDECDFGPPRIRGRRGCGAGSKTFGL